MRSTRIAGDGEEVAYSWASCIAYFLCLSQRELRVEGLFNSAT